MESIDEKSPQTPARIRLSPPQVFTREHLINDRRIEDGFLKEQLDKSKTATLGSSLARDLQTISALSAQLSISFDPAAKLNFQKQTQLADLQQQIDVVQLQGQLLTLQNQLQALQSGTGSGPAAPSTSPSTTVTSGTSTTASDARITSLQARVDSALTALAALGAAAIRPNSVTTSTPEDEFEDRLALRARIREAINANTLDDAHDIDGNAIYHLQFTATLLPPGGKEKNTEGDEKKKSKAQFGIARIKIEPPKLEKADIEMLYNTWLAMVTNRMNQSIDNRTDVQPAMSYQMLGPITGLYDVAEFKIGENGKLLLAVRPGDGDEIGYTHYDKNLTEKITYFSKYLQSVDDACLTSINDLYYDYLYNEPTKIITSITSGKGCSVPQDLIEKLTALKKTDGAQSNTKQGKTAKTKPKHGKTASMKPQEVLTNTDITDLLDLGLATIQLKPSVETSVFALGDRSLLPDTTRQAIQKNITKFNDTLLAVKSVFDQLSGACVDKEEEKACRRMYEIDPTPIPPQFCKALLVGENNEPLDCTALGKPQSVAFGVAYPYSVDPVLRSQRISTVASAANALDLAASVAAQVPQAGVGVGAGLGYSRRAAGRADTIERVPQVFGFAGPSPIAGQDKTQAKKGKESEESKQAKKDKPANEEKKGQQVDEAEDAKPANVGTPAEDAKKGQQAEEYEFGWVFGPKVSLDANGSRLLLRQVARTQQVSADVSMPAWWPRATLHVRTAWKGAFPGGGSILDNDKPEKRACSNGSSILGNDTAKADPDYDEYCIPVRFRNLNPATFDALTVRLARVLTGQGFHQARIDMVRPSVIPVCADATNKKINILIYGIDLWRNPTVFIGGQLIQSSDITVMPDMTGITAAIDTSLISKAALDKDPKLVVWTAYGVAETDLNSKVVIGATCESDAGTPAKSSAPSFKFTSAITTLAPGSTGKMRVLITFPAGQASSITISAKGSEITGAKLTDAKSLLKNITLKTAGGSVTVTASKAPAKDAKPVAVDLSFRGLVEGATLTITANATPKDKSKIEPISLTIAVKSKL